MENLLTVLSLLLLTTFGEAWFLGPKKPVGDSGPNWSELSVTFKTYRKLPLTEADAISKGWTKDTDCGASSFFRGNRYIKSGDTGAMLLFDSQGKVAGIQAGIPDTVKIAQHRIPPFHLENGKYYLTTYFVDPATICDGSKRAVQGIGDSLRIQTGHKWQTTMNIPLKETGLTGTKWVKGKCFMWKMGQHYWYNISNNMDCDDFFPIFLLYNDGKLNGFGIASGGYFDNPNYEHPPSYLLGLFFKSETKPACLSKNDRSTMHIYLQPATYSNYNC